MLVSLAVLGFLSALVIDLGTLFACSALIPDHVVAITLLAIGTSLPGFPFSIFTVPILFLSFAINLFGIRVFQYQIELKIQKERIY